MKWFNNSTATTLFCATAVHYVIKQANSLFVSLSLRLRSRFCCSRLDLEMYNDNLSCTLKDIQIPKRISALMRTVWLSALNYQPFNSPCTSLAGKMRSHKVNRR